MHFYMCFKLPWETNSFRFSIKNASIVHLGQLQKKCKFDIAQSEAILLTLGAAAFSSRFCCKYIDSPSVQWDSGIVLSEPTGT